MALPTSGDVDAADWNTEFNTLATSLATLKTQLETPRVFTIPIGVDGVAQADDESRRSIYFTPAMDLGLVGAAISIYTTGIPLCVATLSPVVATDLLAQGDSASYPSVSCEKTTPGPGSDEGNGVAEFADASGNPLYRLKKGAQYKIVLSTTVADVSGFVSASFTFRTMMRRL